MSVLKGEVSRKFAVISKTQVSRINEIVVKFVIKYHPCAIKLSISAADQRKSMLVWIGTMRLMFFKLSHVCFQNALEQMTSCSFQGLI